MVRVMDICPRAYSLSQMIIYAKETIMTAIINSSANLGALPPHTLSRYQV